MLRFIIAAISAALMFASYSIKAEDRSVDIIFGGDISFAGVIYHSVKSGNCTYNESFEQITDLFDSDIAIANLESPFGNVEHPPSAIDNGKPVHLLADPRAVDALKLLKLDAVSLANNHFADYDETSMNTTVETLTNHNIKYSGVNYGRKTFTRQQPVIIKRNGIKLGILSYCANDQGCANQRNKTYIGTAVYESKVVLSDVKKLRKVVDIIIVFLHWGEEFTVLQEDFQVKVVRSLHPYVDAIIGSHQHIPGPHYYINNTIVVQSLGNFLFPMRNTPHVAFNVDHDKGTKQKAREMYKLTEKFKNPSSIAKLIKLTFNKKGVVRDKSYYLHLEIGVSNKHCLHLRKRKKDSTWQVLCNKNDKNCHGDNNCNVIECKDKNKAKKLGITVS